MKNKITSWIVLFSSLTFLIVGVKSEKQVEQPIQDIKKKVLKGKIPKQGVQIAVPQKHLADFYLEYVRIYQPFVADDPPPFGSTSIGKMYIKTVVTNAGSDSGNAMVTISFARSDVKKKKALPGDLRRFPVQDLKIPTDQGMIYADALHLNKNEGQEVVASWWPKAGKYFLEVQVIPQDFVDSDPSNNVWVGEEQVHGTDNLRLSNFEKHPPYGILKVGERFATSMDLTFDSNSGSHSPQNAILHLFENEQSIHAWQIHIYPSIHLQAKAWLSWDVPDVNPGTYNSALEYKGQIVGQNRFEISKDERAFVAEKQPELYIHEDEAKLQKMNDDLSHINRNLILYPDQPKPLGLREAYYTPWEVWETKYWRGNRFFTN